MCRPKLPSRISCPVPVITSQGVGKITLWVPRTVNHHAPISKAMTATAGRKFFIVATLSKRAHQRPCAPGDSRHGRARVGFDDDGHLAAGVCRARELVLRRPVERQPET